MSATSRSATSPLERAFVLLLLAGTVLLPFQLLPPMPLPGMQLSDAIFGLAFACYLLGRPAWPPITVAVLIAVFSAGVAVSAAFGGSFAKLLGHFELAALGWMAAAVPDRTARSIRLALVSAAAIGAALGLAGIVLFYLGFETPLIQHLGVLAGEGYPRARGLMVRSQMMASFLMIGLLLLRFEPDLLPRTLGLVVSAAILITAAFAFSRTVPVAVLALAAIWAFSERSPAWARWAWIAAALGTALLIWISIRYQVVLNPLDPWSARVLEPDPASLNQGVRYTFWQRAVQTIAANPLVGAGPGVLVADGWTAHNTWLNLWGGLGIVPMLAFAALLAMGLMGAIRARLAGVAVALAVLTIEGLYTDIEDMRHFWLVLGIALGAWRDRTAAQQ